MEMTSSESAVSLHAGKGKQSFPILRLSESVVGLLTGLSPQMWITELYLSELSNGVAKYGLTW